MSASPRAWGTSAGYVPDSLSNTLRPVFASWLGWLVESDQRPVFVLDNGQNRDDLVRPCLDVGHERLVGELEGGVDAWVSSGRPIGTIPFAGVTNIAGAVIDVRQDNEYANGHVPGARNVELGQIATAELTDEPLTVMCGHGEGAMTGASLLARRGHHDVVVLDGGPDTWATETGLLLESGS